MGHSYSDMLTHIVFSTKQRQLTLTDELKPKLFPYMAGIIEELEGKVCVGLKIVMCRSAGAFRGSDFGSHGYPPWAIIVAPLRG